MAGWTLFVELTRFALFAAAHLFGGSVGAGIFAFSLLVRITLIPLTLRTARETRAFVDKKTTVPPKGRIASLIQLPVGAAIYRVAMSAVPRGTRFLWIRDLTRPDVGLAMIAAAIAAVVARATGGDHQRIAMALGATLTFVFAWRMSASIGLYSLAWSSVSAIEALVVRRTAQTA